MINQEFLAKQVMWFATQLWLKIKSRHKDLIALKKFKNSILINTFEVNREEITYLLQNKCNLTCFGPFNILTEH